LISGLPAAGELLAKIGKDAEQELRRVSRLLSTGLS
jgi:hypothetical protein